MCQISDGSASVSFGMERLKKECRDCSERHCEDNASSSFAESGNIRGQRHQTAASHLLLPRLIKSKSFTANYSLHLMLWLVSRDKVDCKIYDLKLPS